MRSRTAQPGEWRGRGVHVRQLRWWWVGLWVRAGRKAVGRTRGAAGLEGRMCCGWGARVGIIDVVRCMVGPDTTLPASTSPPGRVRGLRTICARCHQGAPPGTLHCDPAPCLLARSPYLTAVLPYGCTRPRACAVPLGTLHCTRPFDPVARFALRVALPHKDAGVPCPPLSSPALRCRCFSC